MRFAAPSTCGIIEISVLLEILSAGIFCRRFLSVSPAALSGSVPDGALRHAGAVVCRRVGTESVRAAQTIGRNAVCERGKSCRNCVQKTGV